MTNFTENLSSPSNSFNSPTFVSFGNDKGNHDSSLANDSSVNISIVKRPRQVLLPSTNGVEGEKPFSPSDPSNHEPDPSNSPHFVDGVLYQAKRPIVFGFRAEERIQTPSRKYRHRYISGNKKIPQDHYIQQVTEAINNVHLSEPSSPTSIVSEEIQKSKVSSPSTSSPTKSMTKSWADLLKKSGSVESTTAPPLPIPTSTPTLIVAKDIVNQLLKGQASTIVQPRGLINNGNMCYMNSVLQPLIHCPPFYQLFNQLKRDTKQDLRSKTALLEAMISFVSEFQPTMVDPESGKEVFGESFAPEYVYDALRHSKRFETIKGRQEDAEEFLRFMLDGLHEEFVALEKARPNVNQIANDDAWVEVGPRNKTATTRQTEIGESPMSYLFGGKTRCVIRSPGSKDNIVVEPFQALQLDISPEHVSSIEDALKHHATPENFVRENIVNGLRTEVDATRQYLVESLPPVLILHLKRFLFTPTGGVQKLYKPIAFGRELEFEPDLLSPVAKSQRGHHYQLFAIVYHHGRHAAGGHYTCDVLRPDGKWLRMDDHKISVIDEPRPQRKDDAHPYLLFYVQKPKK